MTGNSGRTWDDASGVHIPLGRTADPAAVWVDVEHAAARAGLSLESSEREPLHERRRYRRPTGLRAFGVSVGREVSAAAQIFILPAFDLATDQTEADAVADFALRLCSLVAPPIARSFSVVMDNGYLLADEFDGPLRWIDWWQYLSAPVVDRVGRSRLQSLDVYQVADGPHNGLVVRATRLPHEPVRRKPLAEHLGIRLKPWRDWHPDTQTWSERAWPL